MKQKIIFALVIILSLVLGFVFRAQLAAALAFIGNAPALIAALRQTGLWGLAVLVVLFILQVFLAFIPGQALMLASGYVYGFWGGTLVTWLSLAVGGQLAFWLARAYGRPFACRFVSPDLLQRWDRLAARQGIAFYAVSLVLPVFPNDAMCYVAGLSEISPRRFLIANLLGRLIASLAMAFVGAYGNQIPLVAWISLAVVALLGLLVWKLRPFLQIKSGGESCQSTIQA